MAALQGRQQIIVDQMAATRDIDHKASCGHGGQQAGVHDAFGLPRQR